MDYSNIVFNNGIILYYYIHHSNITLWANIVFKKAPSSHHQSVDPPPQSWRCAEVSGTRMFSSDLLRTVISTVGPPWIPPMPDWFVIWEGVVNTWTSSTCFSNIAEPLLFRERAASPVERSRSRQGVLLPWEGEHGRQCLGRRYVSSSTCMFSSRIYPNQHLLHGHPGDNELYQTKLCFCSAVQPRGA